MALPDGGVGEQEDLLVEEITLLARSFGITQFHTLGSTGYDGHADHIATHNAALLAAKKLEIPDTPTVWALNAEHQGARAVTGDALVKLGAMACHVSQLGLDSPDFWESFAGYAPLIWEQETYDNVTP